MSKLMVQGSDNAVVSNQDEINRFLVDFIKLVTEATLIDKRRYKISVNFTARELGPDETGDEKGDPFGW